MKSVVAAPAALGCGEAEDGGKAAVEDGDDAFFATA
jgi:hypothetical protein